MLELNEEWFAYYVPALLMTAVELADNYPGGALDSDLQDHLKRLLCSNGATFDLCFHRSNSYFNVEQRESILQAADFLDRQQFTEGLALCIRQKMNEQTYT